MENPEAHRGPVTRGPSVRDRLRAWPQYLLPGHALSRVVLALTRSRVGWWKDLMIGSVARLYGVDLAEAAVADPRAYPSFNAFFTRPLARGARPLDGGDRTVVCPIDGVVSQAGAIGASESGRIFQAKGKSFSAVELLGGSAERAAPFRGGAFVTLYLSPRDYHRIHMPLAGRLRQTVHVPGRLFSVDAATTRTVPRLFARNERVAALFDTEAGPMALVLVGALFVSAIETVWRGLVTPPRGRTVRAWSHPPTGDGAVSLARGEEMGRFNMGSTVIVLFGPGAVAWRDGLAPEAEVGMGRAIGDLTGNSSPAPAG
jgi:phosphatidylserine decarboxylase